MARPTYVPISSTTVATDATEVVLNNFSGYSDLFLVVSTQSSTGSSAVMGARFNGDTGSNYSTTYTYNTSTTAPSGKEANGTGLSAGDIPATGSVWGISHYYVTNYSGSSNYKNILMRHNAGVGVVVLSLGLWRNTSPVTSITFYGANIKAGSVFTVYGIL